MKNKAIAVYNVVTEFVVDFDLNSVHDYYVKWERLYVQHNKGDDYVEVECYKRSQSETFDYKYPHKIELDEADEDELLELEEVIA